MAAWEVVAPRRSQAIGRWVRWPNNLGVVIIDERQPAGEPIDGGDRIAACDPRRH
jgi:hypothetical protein